MTPAGRVARVLMAVGLGDIAFRAYQRWLALRAETGTAADGLPLPPPYLRVLTGGAPEAAPFTELGARAAEELLSLARNHGADLTAEGAVLDFGCGCGRIARYVAGRQDARFVGCDINPRLVRWCAENLPGEYRVTRLRPPLPFEAATFSLVYSVSVFTHLGDQLARAWLSELARVTRPGGLALLTFHDEKRRGAEPLQKPLETDGFAVRYRGREGSNLLCGFFTAEGFAARAPDWEMVDCLASDRSASEQAVAVLRRRAAVSAP